jgi:hypothetical protein
VSGRYAKVMGDHWRTRAAKVSLAANGLWAVARTYIADNASDGVVHETFLAGLCGGKVDRKALSELLDAGWWESCEGGYLDVTYLDENISRARAEELRGNTRERVAKHRATKSVTPPDGNDGGSAPRNNTGNDSGNALHDTLPSDTKTPRHQDPDIVPTELVAPPAPPSRPVLVVASSADSEPAAAPAKPANDQPATRAADESAKASERIVALESRYPAELVVSVRAGCARYRKTGRIADSVWLATLERLDAFAPEMAVAGMRTFVDRYSDGSKDENYLLGIVRNERERGAKSSGWRPPTTRAEYAESAGAADLFGNPIDTRSGVTAEDLARIERMGNRRAHG